jgi:hypothetical protein
LPRSSIDLDEHPTDRTALARALPLMQWRKGARHQMLAHADKGPRAMSPHAQPDWRAWSREAVHLMQERNSHWVRDYGLEHRR